MKRLSILILLVTLIACKEYPEIIIEKNIEVRGGKANFENIKNLFLQVSINTMGMDVPVKFYIVRPSTMRTEVNFGGQELVTLLLPDTIIAIVDNKITPLPAEARAEMNKNLETQLNYFRSELMDFKQQGGRIVETKLDKFRGKEAHRFKISYPDGSISYVFIDKNSYLNLGTRTEKMIQGEKIETETYYSDYRKTANLMVPFKTEVYSCKTLLASIKIDSVAINKPFEPKIFSYN